MIKAIIIDDEEKACQVLKFLIEKYVPEITSLETVSSPVYAIERIFSMKPDLVFLDIQMPVLNGFDLLNKLPEINFDIIFTSAFNQYAIKAIRFSALDYLLKPIDVAELQNAVKRHLQRKIASEETKLQYQNLVKNLSAPDRQPISLAVNGAHGMQFLKVNEIIRLEGDRNYTSFILSGSRKLLSSKTMKEYEEMLCDKGFVRIHKSHIVNVDHVKKIHESSLEMKDGTEVEISRRRYAEVMKVLSGSSY